MKNLVTFVYFAIMCCYMLVNFIHNTVLSGCIYKKTTGYPVFSKIKSNRMTKKGQKVIVLAIFLSILFLFILVKYF